MHRFPRLHQALDYVADAHNGQVRKGTAMPYLAHLLGVCALVLEHGGDEDQAIAGLLHDVVEDCGEHHRQAVRVRFGDRVADIVEGCTDGVADRDGKKAPWTERKTAYLAHLAAAPLDTILVSACDKLYNARAIAADLRMMGQAVFDKFSVPRDQTLWYYRALRDIFVRRLGPDRPLVVELNVALSVMGPDP